MKKFILLFTTALLTAASCNKEKIEPIDTTEVNVSFKATFGGEPLVLNINNYEYLDKPVRFSKVNFYVSDIAVLKPDGETEISEIQFIDLTKTHTSEQASREGTIMNFPKIPVGEYNGLKFGIGVSADLNRTTPSDYATSHPLGADNSGEYWPDWDSYIFAKIEGQYDLNGDGFDGEDIAFAYHTGTDKVYQELIFENLMTLKRGSATNLNFELDIKELLTLPRGDLIELEQHDPNNQVEEMIIIMKNFKNALKLK